MKVQPWLREMTLPTLVILKVIVTHLVLNLIVLACLVGQYTRHAVVMWLFWLLAIETVVLHDPPSEFFTFLTYAGTF